jgi:hypothetical protein
MLAGVDNVPAIASDLVEYLVLSVPEPAAMAVVAAEIVRAVDAAAIRVLDLVVLRVDELGAMEILDTGTVGELQAVVAQAVHHEVLLSQHDLELISLVLHPGDCAVVVVAEDRWAVPLAEATRSVGGEVRAGERIARDRIETALAGAARRNRGSRT